MTEPTIALAPIAPLQQALALATEAGDMRALKEVHALASALRKGAQARGMGVQAENQAAEVVLRSERAMGQRLADMLTAGLRRASGKQTGRGQGKEVASLPPTIDEVLSDAGIKATPPMLQGWRLLSEVPDDLFEQMIVASRERAERLAKVDFYRAAKPDAKAQDARREVMEAWHAEDATPAYKAFAKATHTLTAGGMAELPTDELAEVGGLIRSLVEAYNAAKAARA